MSATGKGKREKSGKVVIPPQSITTNVSSKRKTFSEEDGDDDNQEQEEKVAPLPKKRGKAAKQPVEVADDDDDEAPEVVLSSADEIKRLRQLHEEMMLPVAKKAKKLRKTNAVSSSSVQPNSNEELDASILEALDDADGMDETDEEDDQQPRKEKINKEARKSRRIGNIEVSILTKKDNIIAAFDVPKTALEFTATRDTRHTRTKFASFRSQRKLSPSKHIAGSR